ncbi:type VI secretion system membrane subunit TssM [Rubrivirga sp.]|uniref:type VI secretion system membrane subunit TssM n=1 Tax=Rubrivirga sp. TaxID=1885344 RepID=UPI003B51ED85
MSRFTRTLRSPAFWIGISALLVLALILSVGAWQEWSWTVRLIGVALVLFACVIALAIVAARAARGAKRIEESMRDQSAQQAATARPARRAEIQRLQEGLDAAIATIKESKLGRGRRGKAALYALPWYVLIGPPAAGKTVAIVQSGLNFPLGIDRVRGVGGTRDCDWFFSDEAILLDTAGRYTTEPEDDEEWLAFLDMLKKNRPGEPINGAVVGISVADLATMEPEDIEHHASNIRRRIDELVRRLGVRFPVYLLFTKADLLSGFVEFFEPLSSDEREGPWGATFPAEDGGGAGQARPAFEREFDVLTGALGSTRAARLAKAENPAERRRSFQFPLEFETVRDRLGRFVEGVFMPNPFQERPLFRGFYFSSGTQEGSPLDPAAREIAERFELPTAPPEGFDPDLRPRSYFLRGLFRDVVIPDAGLVQRTAKSALRFRAGWVGAAVAGAVLLTLFVVGTANAALRSRAVVDDVEAAARVAGSVTWAGGAEAGDIARVTALRDQVARLERYDADPPSFGWGLYRGDDLIEPAQTLFEQKVRAYAGRVLLPDLERGMREAVVTSAGGPEGEGLGAQSQLYSDLRAYLLMTTDAARLEGDVEREFLAEHLLSTAEVPRSDAADPDSVAAMVRRQVDSFVDALADRRVQPFEAKEILVADARRLVYEPPTADRLYDRIREAGASRYPPVSLASALGGGGGDFFATNPAVSGFYTREAYRQFVRPAVVRWARSPDRIDWVMGYSAGDLPATMRNAGQLAGALRDRYYQDYITAWTRFLKALRLKPAGTDPIRAGRFLTILGDPNESPIVTALAAVSAQTQLAEGGGETAERLGGVAERAAEGAVRRRLGRANRIVGPIDIEVPTSVATPVDRAFAGLHALAPDEVGAGGGGRGLLQGLQALAGVGSALEGVAGNDARAAQFFAQAAQGSGPVADARRTVETSLSGLDRDVRSALFLAPLRGLGGSLVGAGAGGSAGAGGPGGGAGGAAPASVRRFLNERWQQDVYGPYASTLAGRYPLSPSSTEVPIAEFEAFFRPESGTLDRFVTEVLGQVGGLDSPAVPASLKSAVRDARRIQTGLFAGETLGLRFEMQPEVPETAPGAPAPGQLYVEMAGTSFTYGMGSRRPWTAVEWPSGSRSTVRVTTREGTLAPVQFEGAWSLFRVLDRASTTAASSTEYVARWPLDRGVTARVNLRARSAANPLGDVRRFFSFRPPSRL